MYVYIYIYIYRKRERERYPQANKRATRREELQQSCNRAATERRVADLYMCPQTCAIYVLIHTGTVQVNAEALAADVSAFVLLY